MQAVAGVVHPICLDAKNEDGKKPFAVFYESHQELLKAAEQWTKGTAGTYITVASLVLTIMFAAAFTIPGGNNQQTGMPIFLDEKIFNMFLIADMVSIFVSASCVLVFIGILTSRYQAMDFYYALPWKLIIGIVLFLLSICSMMVALYAALSLILKGNHTGSRGFILGFMLFLGGVPVIILLVSQLRFIYKFIRSTIKNPVSSI
ncbi:ankyrin repeat protein [Trifolium pratense]|uniref:Ankyrin repeat protein n=1 Tax=Trifolium pratense TaxID=57577 RepID=A0A2K3MLB6_TRIPR|nr:ankyrin repeat protein [Trifolium pratense]